MKRITTIWFEAAEREKLSAAARSVGVDMDQGEERTGRERLLRGIAQSGDVVSQERLVNGMLVVQDAITRLSEQTTLDYWASQAVTPGCMSETESRMADVLTEARRQQVEDLMAGLDVIQEAIVQSDAKPVLEKYVGN